MKNRTVNSPLIERLTSQFLLILFFISVLHLLSAGNLQAQQSKDKLSDEELAKKLANPVSSLISLPLQNNSDFGIGEHDGNKNTLNIQPVIPLGLSKKLNLIIRVVQPVITQYNVTGAGEHQSGLGDATVSAFFSPAVVKKGIIWGAGPAFLIPDGTKDLSGKKTSDRINRCYSNSKKWNYSWGTGKSDMECIWQ